MGKVEILDEITISNVIGDLEKMPYHSGDVCIGIRKMLYTNSSRFRRVTLTFAKIHVAIELIRCSEKLLGYPQLIQSGETREACT